METKRFSIIKPTLTTPFHIDFDWWQHNDRNWRSDLVNCLCPDHQQTMSSFNQDQEIDWIDPQTAEVFQIDALQHILITHCANQEGFITEHTRTVDAVFRLLLSNRNEPMTPLELGERLRRDADKILSTIGSLHVYKGIRALQR
jgi:hypothetical protein